MVRVKGAIEEIAQINSSARVQDFDEPNQVRHSVSRREIERRIQKGQLGRKRSRYLERQSEFPEKDPAV
jgi:hypothetical protein